MRTEATDIEGLVTKLVEENRKAMLEFVKELRKPTEEEQRKRDEERAKKMRDEAEALKTAQAQVASEEMRRKNCRHGQMFAGQFKHAWRGQVSSGDNMVRAHCNLCRTEAPIFKATQQMIVNGINLEAQNVSLNSFSEMHRASFPTGCPRPNCWVCHSSAAKETK